MKIQVIKNWFGVWRWRLVDRNGRILAHSEQYSSYHMAMKTAVSVGKRMVDVEIEVGAD